MINKPLLEQQAIIYGALYDFTQYLVDNSTIRLDPHQGLNRFVKERDLPIFYQPETRWARYIEMVHAPVEWSGAGLPPVGAVCEVDGSAGPTGFAPCVILYSSQDVTVWKYAVSDLGPPSEVEHWAAYGEREFRLIRTPEQIAAEQRNAAQKAIQDLILSCFKIDKITAAGIAGVVADADYRKFEIVPE